MKIQYVNKFILKKKTKKKMLAQKGICFKRGIDDEDKDPCVKLTI